MSDLERGPQPPGHPVYDLDDDFTGGAVFGLAVAAGLAALAGLALVALVVLT